MLLLRSEVLTPIAFYLLGCDVDESIPVSKPKIAMVKAAVKGEKKGSVCIRPF